MAYAQFDIPNAYTTTQTLFGVAGQWIPLPAAFPPIQFVSTSSIAFPDSGDFTGALIMTDTTSAGNPIRNNRVVQIEGYIKGGKWLYLSGAAHPLYMNPSADTAGPIIPKGTLKLYYRAVGEGVEI